MVETPDDCVRFVNERGIVAWSNGTPLPSVADATPWGERVMFHTWFWKDDLHLEKRLCYGQFWGAGVPLFVSLEMLPALIAAQGDNDPRTLYEAGRLSHLALSLYEHVERHGPTPKNRLPYPAKTSQTPPLAQLQQRFLITKVALTGRTRGTYGYLWGLCDEFWPEAFAEAAKLSPEEGRERVLECLRAGGVTISDVKIARALRWDFPQPPPGGGESELASGRGQQ